MTSETPSNTTIEAIEKKGLSSSFKLFISFFILIINVETISFLLLGDYVVITLYQKALSFIALAASSLFFFKWRKLDRYCFLIFVLLLSKLVIESITGFGSILIYPSILSVIFPFLYVYFIKNFYKKINFDVLKPLMAAIFIGYFVFMFLFGHDFDFSNTPILQDESGPYSGDTRILHANSILLIVLPFLFFLNKMFSAKKTFLSIAGFSLSLVIILVHQHRTVWLVTILSSFLLVMMKSNDKKILRKLLFFLLLIIGVFTVLIIAVPGLNQLLMERFVDVLDPLNEDNTGGFRYLQILAYLNFFIQKPIFGWTFSGFELSNPFLLDNWEEGSGHHFHNAYIEVLFYFGITGFLLKWYPLYSIAKRISKQLSDKSKILAAFSTSGLLYSFSYVPPLAFWGIVGLCLYYIERDMSNYNFNQLKQSHGQA